MPLICTAHIALDPLKAAFVGKEKKNIAVELSRIVKRLVSSEGIEYLRKKRRTNKILFEFKNYFPG